MTWKARVEWVLTEQDGGKLGDGDSVAVVFGSETLTSSGAVGVSTEPAPSFRSGTLGSARITVLSGAVLVGIDDETPSEEESLRLEAQPDPYFLTVREGQVLYFLEAADGPTATSTVGGGGASGDIGAAADAVATTDTGSFSLISLFKRSLQKLTQLVSAATDTSDVPIKGPASAIVSAAPVVSTAQYTAGDCIGGLMTFTGITRGAGLAAIIQTALIQSKSAQTFACDLIIFHSNPAASTFTDNAPIAIAAADFDKVAARVPFVTGDWSALGTPSVAEVSAQGRLIRSSGADVYAVLVARATPTLASTSDLKVVLKSMPD